MSALLFCGVPRFGRFVARATTILLFGASAWTVQARHNDTLRHAVQRTNALPSKGLWGAQVSGSLRGCFGGWLCDPVSIGVRCERLNEDSLRSSVRRTNALLSRELWGAQVSGSFGGCPGEWLSDPVSISVYRETPIKNRKDKAFAVRTELGLGGLVDAYVFSANLLASVEFRSYYNLKKRFNTSKDIEGNAGDFVAARIYLRSPGIPLSPEPTTPEPEGHSGRSISAKYLGILGIIPTWGIRRNMGRYINYEIGGGVGVDFFTAFPFFLPAAEMHLRVGYRFADKGRP